MTNNKTSNSAPAGLTEGEQTGVVDSWNDDRGFGFIVTNTQPRTRVFAHVSEIVGEGIKTLDRGVPVSFTVKETKRGLQACGIRTMRKKGDTFVPVQSRLSSAAASRG